MVPEQCDKLEASATRKTEVATRCLRLLLAPVRAERSRASFPAQGPAVSPLCVISSCLPRPPMSRWVRERGWARWGQPFSLLHNLLQSCVYNKLAD